MALNRSQNVTERAKLYPFNLLYSANKIGVLTALFMMHNSVYLPKIIQLYHPSGELYKGYRHFSDAHPEATWFQSDAFFRFAALWPEATPILLVAFRQEALRDPGRQYSKMPVPKTSPGAMQSALTRNAEHQSRPSSPTSSIRSPANSLTQSPHNPVTACQNQDHKSSAKPSQTPLGGPSLKPQAPSLMGSLLAVVIQNPVPRMVNFFPLASLYKRFTTRTVVYGGPLLAEGSRLEQEMTLKTLLGALRDTVGKHSLFTRFHNFYGLTDYKPLFHAQGYRYHDRLSLLVDTPDKDTVWKNMSATLQSQVCKSLTNDAEIIYNPSPAQIDQYYDILKNFCRKKVGNPLPSRTFFHALSPDSDQYTVPGFRQQYNPNHPTNTETSNTPTDNPLTRSSHNPAAPRQNPDHTSSPNPPQTPPATSSPVIPTRSGGTSYTNPVTVGQRDPSQSSGQAPNHSTTILIRHKERIIGGITCPIHPGRAIYAWYVCGLDCEYRSHGIYPSVLATWAAIDYAAENGIPAFAYMGPGRADEKHEGDDFKACFGGKWVNCGQFSRVNKRVLYAILFRQLCRQ